MEPNELLTELPEEQIQMLAVLNEAEKNIFFTIHKKLILADYRGEFSLAYKGWKVRYFYRKSKKMSFIFEASQSGNMAVKVRLTDPNQIVHRFDGYSPHVLACILERGDCRDCCHCNNDYRFEYKGVSYRKCHMLCDNFIFSSLTEEDRASMVDLFDAELEVEKKNKPQRT